AGRSACYGERYVAVLFVGDESGGVIFRFWWSNIGWLVAPSVRLAHHVFTISYYFFVMLMLKRRQRCVMMCVLRKLSSPAGLTIPGFRAEQETKMKHRKLVGEALDTVLTARIREMSAE